MSIRSALFACALAAAGVATTVTVSGPATAAPIPARTVPVSCRTAAGPDVATCHLIQPTPASTRPMIGRQAATPAGLTPADLISAYNLGTGLSGTAVPTVAVIEAYDDPNVEADLAVYRAQFGLPSCLKSTGCLRVVNQTGGTTLPAADAGWAEETTLDVDMVSAICRLCHVLVVEATSPSIANLGQAINEAVTLGAKYVSMSFGGSDSPGAFDPYLNRTGVAFTAASGDAGYGVQYPAGSRFVTTVGGTKLTRTATGWSETAWSGSSGGCSGETKPTWQVGVATICSSRATNDVAVVADPNTGVAVYDTYGGVGGWLVFGGTSVGAPIIAGVYALAGTPAAGTYPASYPYAHRTAFHDITSPHSGTCTVLTCAGPGWDGPTGWGSPNGTAGFRQ